MYRTANRPRVPGVLTASITALALVAACAGERNTPVAPDAPSIAADRGHEHGKTQSPAIAFGSRRDGGPPEIWVMNADGSDPLQLTNSTDPVTSNGQPDWSPNGRRLAFMSTRTGDAEIFTMRSDGSDPVNLTNHPATDQAPVWAPGGKRVAFHSNRDGNFELYVLKVRTGELTRLTTHTGVDQFPDWSPNGRKIVFQRDGDIHVMDLRTGQTTQLTATPQLEDMPTWSPNGKQIAFMSQRDGYPSVYVMDADGGNPVNLTSRPVGVTTPWQSAFPGWSKNGERIYFQSARPETAGDVELFVVDAAGGTATRLTVAPGIDSAPVAR